jgi:hypothetical protein
VRKSFQTVSLGTRVNMSIARPVGRVPTATESNQFTAAP